MATFDELEARYLAGALPSRVSGRVRRIIARKGDGVHESATECELTPEEGMRGDRWLASKGSKPAYQITLIEARVAEIVTDGRAPVEAPGDNFHVDLDLSEGALPAGTHLRVGDTVLSVSKEPHTPCGKFAARCGEEARAWVAAAAHGARRLRGINARVLVGGRVRVGDAIEVLPASEQVRRSE